jgi:hypothetical protein
MPLLLLLLQAVTGLTNMIPTVTEKAALPQLCHPICHDVLSTHG